MNQTFHYDVIYVLALKAGFNEENSFKIAYSSQYVDDNNEEITVLDNSSVIFKNQISQTMNIFKPQEEQLLIYPCFHFIPGEPFSDSARRNDGRTHPFNTTPNSDNAQRMINEALNTGSVYRIGIAVHAYADTWAHQNFLGIKEKFNSLGNVLMPNIGHADAFQRPDIPRLIWNDSRLIPENQTINNKIRFLDAAQIIFSKFKKHLFPSISDVELNHEWLKVQSKLDTAFGESIDEKDVKLLDEKNVRDDIKEYRKKLASKDYDKKLWLSNAVEIEKRDIPEKLDEKTIKRSKYLKKDIFEKSDWYQFQVAIKEHQDFVTGLLADVFNLAGLNKK